MTAPTVVHFRVLYGGTFFKCPRNKVKYRPGQTHVIKDYDPDEISKVVLENVFKEEIKLSDIKELWYLLAGQTIDKGLTEVENDLDTLKMLKTMKRDRMLHIYVIQGDDISPHQLRAGNLIPQHPLSEPTLEAIPQPSCLGSNTSVSVSVAPKFSECGDDSEHEVLGSESSEAGEDFQFRDNEDEEDDLFYANVVQQVVRHDFEAEQVEVVSYGVVEEDEGLCVGVEQGQVVSAGVIEEDSRHVVRAEPREPVLYLEDDGGKDGEEDYGDEDSMSLDRSDDESNKLRMYPKYYPSNNPNEKIHFKPGMIFGSAKIVRAALRNISIQSGGEFYFLHNDKERITVLCNRKCPCPMVHSRKKCTCNIVHCAFKVVARRVADDGTFQLKFVHQTHECSFQHTNAKMTSVWLAEKYLENYRDDPTWKLSAFRSKVNRDYKVDISYTQAWRARLRAILKVNGNCEEEYAQVWNYAFTIKNRNPGSSAFVKVCLDEPAKPIFERLYICLKACKEGFLRGCRPIIGLDGCHLRGAYTGQILVAVSKDGNNNIFPIAFAVVEAERKETWAWFVNILLRDIGECNPTFISDRQKGLIGALSHEGVALSKTRVCVRHLYANFKLRFPGQANKDAIWTAARAYTKRDFEKAMEGIKESNVSAYNYLMEQDPITWSRHGFGAETKSDMLLNNLCESFNAFILPAREKSILSMAEWIRRQFMLHFRKKKEGMEHYEHKFTPNARKAIEAARIEGMTRCLEVYGGGNTYEVDHYGRTYIVNLESRQCTCFKWELTGIPCPHAMRAILRDRREVDDFVHEYYSKEMYLRAYSEPIHAMPGIADLDICSEIPPLPPKYIVQPGRPKKHARKKSKGEEPPSANKRIRISGKRICSNCGQQGHYKNKCNQTNNLSVQSTKPKWNRGRPTDRNTVHICQKKKAGRKAKMITPEVQLSQALSDAPAHPSQITSQDV